MNFSWILLVVLNRFEEQNCVGGGSKRWKCLEFVSVEVGPGFRSTSIHFIKDKENIKIGHLSKFVSLRSNRDQVTAFKTYLSNLEAASPETI